MCSLRALFYREYVMLIPFSIGDDVIDLHLETRGLVCDISKEHLEVDYLISVDRARQLNINASEPTIITGVYNTQGFLLRANKVYFRSTSPTLISLHAFNAFAEKAMRIQRLLNTKLLNVRNNP